MCSVVDVKECDSNPCENRGTCTDAVNEYICKCVVGYTGANCQIGMNYLIIGVKFKEHCFTYVLIRMSSAILR